MVCSPWAAVQVTVSPPIWAEPSQWKVRLYRSGIFSRAAARVTVLNTEPGVNEEDRNRLRYTP